MSEETNGYRAGYVAALSDFLQLLKESRKKPICTQPTLTLCTLLTLRLERLRDELKDDQETNRL